MNVVILTNLAEESGFTFFSRALNGKPIQGTTIDQASTQRRRYTRSSSGMDFSRSSTSKVRGFSTSPVTSTVQGEVSRVWTRGQTFLRVLNSKKLL